MALAFASLPETLFQNIWTAGIVYINCELICNGSGISIFLVIYFKFDWLFLTLRPDSLEAAATTRVASLFNA